MSTIEAYGVLFPTSVVGSMPRPDFVRELLAGDAAVRGADAEPYLDAAVASVVSMQEAAGLDVVSDGEMRRLSFQSQLAEAVSGFGDWDVDAFLWGD